MSIKNTTKKTLIDWLSDKLIRSKLKSNNSIETKCLKYIVKKILSSL